MLIDLELKNAQKNDLIEIESIIRDAYNPIAHILSRPPGVLVDTAIKLKHSLENNFLYKICNQNDEILGTLSLTLIDQYKAKIFHFAIKPYFQNKGIGTWSLRQVIIILNNQYPQITTIELEIYYQTPRLLHFYQKFGFSIIKDKEIRGEKILILSKSLD